MYLALEYLVGLAKLTSIFFTYISLMNLVGLAALPGASYTYCILIVEYIHICGIMHDVYIYRHHQ